MDAPRGARLEGGESVAERGERRAKRRINERSESCIVSRETLEHAREYAGAGLTHSHPRLARHHVRVSVSVCGVSTRVCEVEMCDFELRSTGPEDSS